MTFKGILDVFIYQILRVKYTLNLSYNMYVSSFKDLFTYPFFGSADCLQYSTVLWVTLLYPHRREGSCAYVRTCVRTYVQVRAFVRSHVRGFRNLNCSIFDFLFSDRFARFGPV